MKRAYRNIYIHNIKTIWYDKWIGYGLHEIVITKSSAEINLTLEGRAFQNQSFWLYMDTLLDKLWHERRRRSEGRKIENWFIAIRIGLESAKSVVQKRLGFL